MRGVAIVMLFAACSEPPPAKRSGYVRVESSQYTSSSPGTGGAIAQFFALEFPTLISSSDPCERGRYQGPTLPPNNSDAGKITITGTRQAITLIPNPDHTYGGYADNTEAPFTGGETLEISAPGEQVPAFTAQLVAPSRLVVNSPLPTMLSELVVPIDQDLAITWTGGSGLVQATVSKDEDVVWCRFPASDGSGAIPASVLASFGLGAGPELTIDAVAFEYVYVDDWRVDVSARFPGLLSNDAPADIYLALE